jgi:hypothetical protein
MVPSAIVDPRRANVRFCLGIAWDAGRSQSERSDRGITGSFATILGPRSGRKIVRQQRLVIFSHQFDLRPSVEHLGQVMAKAHSGK